MKVRLQCAWATVAAAAIAVVVMSAPTLAAAAPDITKAPLPNNGSTSYPYDGVSMFAISCLSVSHCVAGGDYATGSSDIVGASWQLADGKWSVTQLPFETSEIGPYEALGVSCPTTANCVAVGDYNTTGKPRALIWESIDGRWVMMNALLPINSARAEGDSSIRAVSCPEVIRCFGGGHFTTFTNSVEPAVWELRGGTWAVSQLPLPGNASARQDAAILSISCPTTTSCVAGGNYVSNGSSRPAIWTMSGGRWKVREAALPPNAANVSASGVDSVTCPSATTCVAGGSYSTTRDISQAAFWQLSGGKWTVTQVRVPPDASKNPGPEISSISCPKPKNCMAGGNYDTDSNTRRASIWILSGSKWNVLRSPIPGDAKELAPGEASVPNIPAALKVAPFSGITAVSCPVSSKNSCVAGGNYLDTNGGHQGFFVKLSLHGQKDGGAAQVVTTTTALPTITSTVPPTTATTTTTTGIAAGLPPCSLPALTAAAQAANPNETGVDPQGYGCSGNWAYAGVGIGTGEDASEATWIFMSVNGSWQRTVVQLNCVENSSSPTIPPSILQTVCNSN